MISTFFTVNIFHLLKKDDGIYKHWIDVLGFGWNISISPLLWLFFLLLWMDVDVTNFLSVPFSLPLYKMMSKQRLPLKNTHCSPRLQIAGRAESDKSKQWDGHVEENYLPEPLAWRQHQDIHLFCTKPESRAREGSGERARDGQDLEQIAGFQMRGSERDLATSESFKAAIAVTDATQDWGFLQRVEAEQTPLHGLPPTETDWSSAAGGRVFFPPALFVLIWQRWKIKDEGVGFFSREDVICDCTGGYNILAKDSFCLNEVTWDKDFLCRTDVTSGKR